MQYAVISDTHDNYYNLKQAIKIIKEHGISTCFHLGDYCAPGVVKAMVAHKELKWRGVWGNVDGARAQIVLAQKGNPNFDISFESFRELDLSEGKVFLTHYPRLAKLAARSGEYKAVFHGHTHEKSKEKLENGTLLANPGELAGCKTGQPSFGIWKPDTNDIEIIDLKDFIVAK